MPYTETKQSVENSVCSAAVQDALREAFELAESAQAAAREQAMSIYTDVTQRDPQCGVAWFNLAVVQFRDGRINESIDSFERAQRFSQFRAVAASAMLNLLMKKHGICDVRAYERIAAPRLPEEFRHTKGGYLGVHGRCYNAANELKNRGYTCEVHVEGLICSVKVKAGDAEYVINLRGELNNLSMSIHRTKNNKMSVLAPPNLNAIERELYYLDIWELPIAQAPIPPPTTADKEQEPLR
jgi:hypothetical protein